MIKLNTKNFKVCIKGEAHSKEIILTLEGVKKNTPYDAFFLEEEMQRRKPKENYETKRRDVDYFKIIHGINKDQFSDKKIKVKFLNDNISLKNYEIFENIPRPGHADFARIKKYGTLFKKDTDIYSGRMTLPIVFAGAVAKMHLKDIYFETKIINILGIENEEEFSKILNQTKEENDSAGCIVRLIVKNLKPGLGDHVYYPLDSMLSSLLFRIPGVKGVSFGVGFSGVNLLGSKFNDIITDALGKTNTNNCGGITSGLSNGNDCIINVFLRPAPSIKKTQITYNLATNKMEQLNIKGSHDSFYQKRAQVVLEAMAAIAIYDLMCEENR